MQRERGYDTLDFLDAVNAEEQRQKEEAPWQSRRFSYIGRGLYGEQMERVFRYFPREQLKVVRSEELRSDFPGAINSIFEFIGVEALRSIRNKERNPDPLRTHDDHGRAPCDQSILSRGHRKTREAAWRRLVRLVVVAASLCEALARPTGPRLQKLESRFLFRIG